MDHYDPLTDIVANILQAIFVFQCGKLVDADSSKKDILVKNVLF